MNGWLIYKFLVESQSCKYMILLRVFLYDILFDVFTLYIVSHLTIPVDFLANY